MVEFDQRMPSMQLYAPPRVLKLADLSSDAVTDQVEAPAGSDHDALFQAANDRAFELLQAIPTDLGVQQLTGSRAASRKATRRS